ncbi:uncharacterized protein LOC130994174 [Salvia miltiorrhiza]|uniref:uncharacterized protein LOC130994174 n=1 Tax=Salvia miltiorrhiza TaxID=226208 RepID=UPI0025ACF7FF|nr:uncharacterized protein LOC130994174 [Salvia miltiorrhiza]
MTKDNHDMNLNDSSKEHDDSLHVLERNKDTQKAKQIYDRPSYANVIRPVSSRKPDVLVHRCATVCPEVINGVISLKIPETMYQDWVKQFQHALIGRFLLRKGEKPRLASDLKTELHNTWKSKSDWQLIPMSKGFYTFKFSTAEDKSIAKRSNFWNLSSGTLRLREWVRNFDPYKEISSLCQVWMRIYYLPVEYWTKEIISSIGRSVGMPIKVDGATADGDIGHFAMVLVEVDLGLPLPESASIDCPDSFFVEFGYEQLPLFCSKCKITGHMLDKCRKRNLNPNEKGTEGKNKKDGAEVIVDVSKDTAKVNDADFRMLKNKANWVHKPMAEQTSGEKIDCDNSFNALTIVQDNIEEISGPDILEALTIPVKVVEESSRDGNVVNAATLVSDSEEENIEQIEMETLSHQVVERNEGVSAVSDQGTNSDSQASEKTAAINGIEQDIRLQQKRGRPPGQANKEMKKIPGADNIKGRLRKATDTKIEPNPEAVESIKEQLYKAWKEGGDPRDFVISNEDSERARVMSKVGAKSWAAEVERGDP